MYNFNTVETESNIRTKFRDVHNIKTTGNTGDLIPFYAKEILPGDDIKMVMKSLTKMTTPNFQTMDQAFLDVFYFYVPRRLLWKHWKAFQGEKIVGPHENQPEFSIPQTTAPEFTNEPIEVTPNTKGTYYIDDPEFPGSYLPRQLPEQYEEGVQYYKAYNGWGENTIADYLGIPTKVAGFSVDSAYFRTYCFIYNEWFRDQNRQDFVDFSDGDETTAGSNGNNPITDALKGGKCLKAAKIHDYFTSSLLTATGSERITLPLGVGAPVFTGAINENLPNTPLVFKTTNGTLPNGNYNIGISQNGLAANTTEVQSGFGNELYTPANLYTDLTQATAATVNQLRLAFQLQKIFEANNRSGSRYIEQLRNRWNVIPSDATLQRPQYLGGKRIPLNIQMVVQTSSTDNTSPLGQIAGFSNTFDENQYFSQRFEEHGIIMGICVVRHQRTYQQGLSKFFTRKNMEDFYMPEFQNLGEQAILNKEIYAQGTDADNEVFGYQEYGAEYRSTPNKVTGQFRSNATNSFDNWHYADDYGALPVNGAEWIVENVDAVDRTLTVTSDVVNQFYFDFQFEETNIRTMPPHSIPGFIDHH